MFRPRSLCQIKPPPSEEQTQNNHKSSLPPNYFNKFPKFSNEPKEFPTKNKKPLKLTQKAYLSQKIERKNIEELQDKEQTIDFNKFLLQFKSLDEVKKLTISDLFGVDGPKLEELKQKCRDFTNDTSLLSEEKSKAGDTEQAEKDQKLMNYFMEQYVQMQDNRINVDIVVDNIDKIKELKYNDKVVSVYFK